MGKYQEIVNLIEHSVPDYTSLKLVPRGTPVFQDLLMTGEIRFARRTGANFAVLNPDNQFTLTAEGQASQSVLSISKILDWFEEGALVTFNKTEMLEVQMWDATTNSLFIKTPLSAPRPVGSIVNLWATPMKVHFESTQGTNLLFVRSRYQIVNGDAVTFPITEALNSLKEIDVSLATFAGNDLDPDYPFIYTLTLREPLPVTLTTESRLYLRAFPAYVSRVLNIPKMRSGQIGPFLLDFVASPLDSVARYDETFSIRTFSAASQVIEGGDSYYVTVGHNYPIVQRPIFAENMIFWRMVRGYGGYILPNRFRMVATSQLQSGEYVARVSQRLVPPMKPGIKYNFKVRANTAGTFVVIAHPYPAVVYNVPVFTDTTVSIDTPADGPPIQRIDFIFKTTRQDTEVTISDATLPSAASVGSFQYQYVFRVLGTTNFQATSIIVKPYFLSLSDLSARYNDGKTYNSGFIYL